MIFTNILTELKNLAKQNLIFEFLIAAFVAVFFELVFLLKFSLDMPIGHWVMTLLNVGVIFCIITLFKNNKKRFIAYLVYIILLLAIFVMDSTLYYFKNDVTSIAMLFEFGRNTMTFGLKYPPWVSFQWYFWLMVLGIVIGFIILLKKVTYLHEPSQERRVFRHLIYTSLVIGSLIAAPVLLSSYNYLVYKIPQDKGLYVERFGLLTYHTQDIINFISNRFDSSFREEDYLAYIEEKLEPEDFIPSIYFNQLQGDNVIMIMLETGEQYAFDPILTPNLFRLMNRGIYFDNFYSAAVRNYTYDAEFKSLTSMMYFNQDNFMHTYGENIYYNALPYRLLQNGYTTSAFHNFEGEFFNRNVIFPNLGFENFYSEEDMELSKTDFWALDSEMIEQMIDQIAPIQESPFYSYILTVTSHGPHNNYRQELEPYYQAILNYVAENDFPEDSPFYMLKMREKEEKMSMLELQFLTLMAAQMDFDKGLGILLDSLEEKDLLDSTTIILYSDHKNYSSLDLTETFTQNSERAYEIDKVPLIISSSKLPQGTINSELISHYDLAPTVMDLLGIYYKPEYYWGQSIFLQERVDKPIILSHSNWISEEMFVSSDQDVEDPELNVERILEMKTEIIEIINLYLAFFITDYFNDPTLFES